MTSELRSGSLAGDADLHALAAARSGYADAELASTRNVPLERVLCQARRLPFVVLVGWLQRLLPTHAAVGAEGPAHAEGVRFRHDPNLSFHDSDVVEAQLVEPASLPPFVQLTTSFAGLTGAASPLPPALVEHLCRDDDDETAVEREFLDLFHHRLLSLFYRGRLKFDLPRSSAPDGCGRTLDWVLLLSGLAPEHAERLTQLPRATLLTLAPLLVGYPANAERIAVALRFVFAELMAGAQLQVVELRGSFSLLEPSSRVRLGVDARLGRSSTLGARAPSPSREIAVQIESLSADACARLCPGGDRHRELAAVTALFCPETIRVAVELMPSTSPVAQLGASGALLGRDAWLHGRGRPEPICFALEPTRTRPGST